MNKPAQQLRKELPYDNDQLWAIVNTPALDLERRMKILEVIMHRIGEHAMWRNDERWKEFRRNALYALYNDPKVFDQLSKSTELVTFIPPGIMTGQDRLYPATFLLQNTLGDLKEPGNGLLARPRLERKLLAGPPRLGAGRCSTWKMRSRPKTERRPPSARTSSGPWAANTAR